MSSRQLREGALLTRDGAVLRHLPLVCSIARKLSRRLPRLDLEDLVSAGTIGLIEALDRFDPDRGVPFGSFAYPRIRGAMIDDARRSGAVARPAVVDQLSFDGSKVGEEGLSLIDVTEDTHVAAPDVRVELRELLEAVSDLPVRERRALSLHAKGYSVAHIARLCGCSDSRASELLVRARLRLEQRTAA
jgi:RNA polymerase sigma factor (sigma-70 family)